MLKEVMCCRFPNSSITYTMKRLKNLNFGKSSGWDLLNSLFCLVIIPNFAVC